MKIITISGAHKGVGKTTLACKILKNLKGFGAIKTTVSRENISITAREEAIKSPGKDTTLLKEAGAEKVVLVSSPRKDLGWALKVALGMVSGCKGVIIEGTSVLNYIKPDVAILIRGRELTRTVGQERNKQTRIDANKEGRELLRMKASGLEEPLAWKESAKKALKKVDLIISSEEFDWAVEFVKRSLKNNPH